MKRPDFKQIKNGAEFNNWYWLKKEMIEICRTLGLPMIGSKFQLRDRIMYALDNKGALKPEVKIKPKSRFNWAKAPLTPETVITDNVSFGPNFKNFMLGQVGKKYVCHIDFQAWVKSNPGKTLADAVAQWNAFEQRNQSPDFQTQIKPHNMYNQYTRDFLKDNPNLSTKEARICWLIRKEMPMENGFVRYKKSDPKLLDN